MKQKDKELLLKDLCARLPYGVKGCFQNSDDKLLRSVTITYGNLKPNGMVMTGDIKPYLFPIYSMKEVIKDEIYQETGLYDIFKDNQIHIEVGTNFADVCKLFNILNKHHLDYNGFIPKGWAKDATGLNIY